MNRYPGGKNGAGMAQQLISLMPRHRHYAELFLGSGAVLRRKRAADLSFAADLDAALIETHRAAGLRDVTFYAADAFELLPQLVAERQLGPRDLVYLDPPYHPSTKARLYYEHELDDAGHRRLLELCRQLDVMVMISGYRCALYDELLGNWHRHDFRAGTHGGARVESVWCNFQPGSSYHDTRFLGGNYRERERIKKRRLRWENRFAGMSHAERAVIYEALSDVAARLDTTRPLSEQWAAAAGIAADGGDAGSTARAGGEDLGLLTAGGDRR